MEEKKTAKIVTTGINVFEFIALSIVNVASFVMPPPFKRGIDQELNRIIPNELLGVDYLLELEKRGIIEPDYVKGELARMGIDPARTSILLNINKYLVKVGELVELLKRKSINNDEFILRASKLGVSENVAKKLTTLSETYLDPDTIIKAWRRKIVVKGGQKDYFNDLIKQGLTDDRVELLKKVSEFYPSAQDLILWQAKEVYEPDSIEKYGLDDEFERLELEPFTKAGISKEQALNYWRSHWQHPSWLRVREMLFRAGMTEKDVWEWFRLVEIPPFWRDKLIKIMYNPFTRVDVRRMNKIGVLSDEETKQAYKDIGYNDDKAEKMLEFTKIYNAEPPEDEKTTDDKINEEMKGLSRAAIVSAYSDKIIKRDEAESYLSDIGLSKEVLEFYLTMAEFEITSKDQKEAIDRIKVAYVSGGIEHNDIVNELGKLALPSGRQETLIKDWDNIIAKKDKAPAKADLMAFLKAKVIKKEGFIDEMSRAGYSLKHINWYLDLLKVK